MHAHVLAAAATERQVEELMTAWVSVSPGSEGASQSASEVRRAQHGERLGWYLTRSEGCDEAEDERERVEATRGRQLVRGSGVWADWQSSTQMELWAQKNGARPGGKLERRAVSEGREGCEPTLSTPAQDPSTTGRQIREGLSLADQTAHAEPDDGGMVGTGNGDHCTLELSDSRPLGPELIGERVQAQGSQDGVAGEDERLADKGCEQPPVTEQIHARRVSRGAAGGEVARDDLRGGGLHGVGGSGVAGRDGGGAVPGVSHPGRLVDAEAAGLGGEAGPQAVGAVDERILAHEGHEPANDGGYALGAQPGAAAVDEDRAGPGAPLGLVELGEGRDGAQAQVSALGGSAGEADQLVAAAVGLGPPQTQQTAVGVFEGVGPVEGDELGSAQRAGEADEEQAAIAQALEVAAAVQALAAQANHRDRERGSLAGPAAAGRHGSASTATQGEPHEVVMRWRGQAVGSRDAAEGGDPARDGGWSSAELLEVRDVERDGLAVEGRFGVEGRGVAPVGPAAKIGAVGPEGVGRVGVRDQIQDALVNRARSWLLVATCWMWLVLVAHVVGVKKPPPGVGPGARRPRGS